MRKSFLLYLSLLISLNSVAKQVTFQQAQEIAINILGPVKSDISTSTPLLSTPVVTEPQPFYAFNGKEDGFVLVAGDDRVNAVIGYSKKGSIKMDNLPPQLKELLENYIANLQYLPEKTTVDSSWSKSKSTNAIGKGMLLETPNWGQEYPYNAQCPILDGVQAPTGCVATAMSIVMKYHNWPENTRGEIKENYYNKDLKFDFSNYHINWNILNDNNSDDLYIEEISKLFYSAGIVANMIYTPEESAAVIWPISQKLRENYKYSPECQFIPRSAFDTAEWNEIIYQQIENNTPIIYVGGNEKTSHAFVIDGYDESGLFHINWGWDGLSNGYFTMDVFNPNGQSFNMNQGMIINIIPDHKDKEYSKIFMPNVDVYLNPPDIIFNRWNFSNSTISPSEKISLSTPYMALNDFTGYIRLAVVDKDDNIKSLFGYRTFSASRFSLIVCENPGFNYNAKNITFPPLKEGERYQLVSQDATIDSFGNMFPREASDDPKDYRIILGGMIQKSYFYADNNFSDVVPVNFHIDEDMPYTYGINYGEGNIFTRNVLRGDGIAGTIYCPHNTSMEVNCTDLSGTSKEPVKNIYKQDFGWSYNITANEDITNIYFKYERNSSRRDESIDSNEIIEEKGLIYKIVDNECVLIGYDNSISSKIIIPDIVRKDGKDYYVTSIADEALMHAPCTEIHLAALHLNRVGQLAFAGIEDLQHFKIDEINPSIVWYPFPKSNISNAYLNSALYCWPHYLAEMSWSGCSEEEEMFNRQDLNYYISTVGDSKRYPDYMFSYFMNYLPSHLMEFITPFKPYKSFNIPGLSNKPGSDELRTFNENIKEMWDYAIDKENKLVKVKPNIGNIEIKEVVINGKTSIADEPDIYNYKDISDGNDLEITVNYILNDTQDMTTVYDAEFNSQVESTILKTSYVNDNFINEKGAQTILVFDLMGNKVYEGRKQNLLELEPGIYIVKDGSEHIRKIMIR